MPRAYDTLRCNEHLILLMVEVSPNLIEILRSTLARVEQTANLRPNDPAVIQLRHAVLSLITELEIEKTRKAA
jgi:hypothetical protein